MSIDPSTCDDIVKRITAHQGVIGFAVFDVNGLAIKSDLDEARTVLLGGLIDDVIGRAIEVAHALGGNFSTIRIHTMEHQVSIAIERDFRVLTLYKLEQREMNGEDDEEQQWIAN